YRQAVALHPESDEAHQRLADTLLIAGSAAEALEQFEWLRARRPEEPALLLGAARCHHKLGQLDQAVALLDPLLARQPDNAAALEERGEIAADQGQDAEAEKWFRAAVAVKPHDRQANYNLFQCLQRLGKTDEAREIGARVDQLDADLKRLDELTRAVL